MKRILIALIALLLLTSLGSAATLSVGKTSAYKYHTIQSAVNAAKSGDTILVANGSYPEIVKFKQDPNSEGIAVGDLKVQGAIVNGKYVYPRVYGFDMGYQDAGADINGFRITKYGISNNYGGRHIFRNNYCDNCGISVWGPFCMDSQIINNKFTNGTLIVGMDSWNVTVKGCTFSKCKVGVKGSGNPIISNCTFSYCTKGVSVDSDGGAGVSYNTFDHCTEGVAVYGGADIQRNKFLYCGTGIHIYPYGNAYMNYNTYTGCKVKIKKDPTPA